MNLGKTVGCERPVSLDVPRLVDTRLLINANSGGGKSYLLRLIAERAGIQTIVLDPEGEFASLREKLDMVLVGRDGEVQANPRAAALLARRLLEFKVSAVIDLFDLKLHERRAFVRSFIESLMHLPRELWRPVLIMLDEAHVYAPERSAGEAESTEAVVTLMSQGRKRGFAGILATQRLSKLHKDAEAEANNVIIGRTWLDIDERRAGELLGFSKEARAALRDLAPGEFCAFGPAFDLNGVFRFRSDECATTHPKPGARHLMTAPAPSDAVKSVLAKLADLPREAETEIRDLAAARTEIARLKREIASKPRTAPDESAIQRAVAAAIGQERAGWIKRGNAALAHLHAIRSAIQRVDGAIEAISGATPSPRTALQCHGDVRTPSPGASRRPLPEGEAIPDADALGKGERRMLTAIAQYDGVDREQLTVLTGYKRSSRDTYIQRLTAVGSAEIASDGKLRATAAGIQALGPDFEPLPTGPALLEYWLSRLSGGEKAILDALAAEYPRALSRDEIGARTGYKRSSRDTFIQRLASRKLAETSRDGLIAAEVLF